MITVNFEAPLVTGLDWNQRILRPANYNHVINAVGGYESASIGLSETNLDMQDWMINGIGRHVETHNRALECVWEGFVNQIDIVYGNLTVTIGPLMQAANRVKAAYSTVDVNVIPPTEGIEAETAWYDDAVSQARYGVLPMVLSVGETNPVDAQDIAQMYLANHRIPPTTQVFSTQPTVPQVTMSCLGYRHWLFYIYNQEVTFGTIGTDAKITDILTGTDAVTGNPYNLNNAWLPFDVSQVQSPGGATPQIPAYEYEDRAAWDLIQGIAARGDTNQNRWLCGVYAGRKMYYNQAPDTVEYSLKLEERGPVIRKSGVPVDPWDVKVGRWLEFTDFDIGRAQLSLQEDPRVMFIESLTYTAPNGLVLNGAPVYTLAQTMASFGLGGTGV